MKVIVGLGNPGKEYEGSRHNAGFVVLGAMKDKLAKKQLTSNKQDSNFNIQRKFEAEVSRIGDVLLVKPQTFMNKSGDSVKKAIDFYKVDLEDLWVVHDDLDIELGRYKVMLGKGPKVHNGVGSVEEAMGSKDFWRVRVGVDSRKEILRRPGLSHQTRRAQDDKSALKSLADLSSRRVPGEKYVLMKFGEEERKVFDGVVDEVVNELVGRLYRRNFKMRKC